LLNSTSPPVCTGLK